VHHGDAEEVVVVVERRTRGRTRRRTRRRSMRRSRRGGRERTIVSAP